MTHRAAGHQYSWWRAAQARWDRVWLSDGCGRLQVERQQDIAQVAGPTEHLHRGLCRNLLAEQLEAVAIWIAEVEALGDDVVEGELGVRAVRLQLLVELLQLGDTTFDLERRVSQAGAANRL